MLTCLRRVQLGLLSSNLARSCVAMERTLFSLGSLPSPPEDPLWLERVTCQGAARGEVRFVNMISQPFSHAERRFVVFLRSLVICWDPTSSR